MRLPPFAHEAGLTVGSRWKPGQDPLSPRGPNCLL